MLLNEAERLGVLQGQAFRSLESAFTELYWSAFESWIWLFGDRIYETQFRPKGSLGENLGAGQQEESSARETVDEDSALEEADDVKQEEGVKPMNARPPFHYSSNSSSINTTSFSHIEYSSVHLSRGVVENVGSAVSVPVSLRSTSHPPHPLPEDFHVLCPCFSLAEAEGAAAEFELPEIVQATFYTILLNEAVELGVADKYTAESTKSSLVDLRSSTFEMDCMDCPLRGAQLYRPTDEVEVRGSEDGQEERSGSAGPSTPSSDEE
ncbi:LOW QUALITY PROTEIN: hypothetical protein Cgig2_003570 [Carnegiea gigantea]|uniref:Uncharacterized protein n=1 Tax=Carnegiea gigantea TaxID=171969 RepID=A0A9Q1Q855_9CARY|nr:LOW QUALITY PROTEIN: hypothetical protein Cgig2_003570 [Carnegiea gigantea]